MNFVTKGQTGRGHWVAVTEDGETRLIGPYINHADANRVAAAESARLSMHGLYRGIPNR